MNDHSRTRLVHDEWAIVMQCLPHHDWPVIAGVSPALDAIVVYEAVQSNLEPQHLVALDVADHRQAHTLIVAARWGQTLYPRNSTSLRVALASVASPALDITIDLTRAPKWFGNIVGALIESSACFGRLTLILRRMQLTNAAKALVLKVPNLRSLDLGLTNADDAFVAELGRLHPLLESLILLDCEHVTNVNMCTGLHELSVGGRCGVGNAGIALLTNLRRLSVRDNMLVTNLQHIPGLQELNASGVTCRIGDEGISKLTQLRTLHASNNTQITNVNHCTRLEELVVSDMSGVQDKGIVKLRNVRKLNVRNNHAITDINHLEKLEELIADSSAISDIGIQRLYNVRVFNASRNPHITTVNHMLNLETLVAANGCGINTTGIERLRRVRKLVARGNCNITGVNNLQDLEELDASECCGIGHSGIACLRHLRRLNSSKNLRLAAAK